MDPLDEFRLGAPVVVRRSGLEGRVVGVYPAEPRPIRITGAGNGPTVFSPHELRLIAAPSNAEHARLRRLEEAVIETVIADMDGTDAREKRGLWLRVALLSGVEDRRTMGRIPHDYDHGPGESESMACWLCGEGIQFYNHTDRDRSDDGT